MSKRSTFKAYFGLEFAEKKNLRSSSTSDKTHDASQVLRSFTTAAQLQIYYPYSVGLVLVI